MNLPLRVALGRNTIHNRSRGGRPMEATQAHVYARQLLETHGWGAILAAAQRALQCERHKDMEQAQAWRRIEAALMLMRGPRAS
jgi:ParB-like chromosome segregation protein Spo0J